jgi:RNA recognition motif-containing protein
MNKRLFIAGLPFSSNDQDIRNHFSSAGVITMVQIIMDKMTGRSKGFGFIEFETEEEAAKAVTMFHETEFGGRKLVVAEAKPMEKREFTPRSGGDDRRPHFAQDASRGKPSYGGGRRDSRGAGDRNDRGFSRGGGRSGGYGNDR